MGSVGFSFVSKYKKRQSTYDVQQHIRRTLNLASTKLDPTLAAAVITAIIQVSDISDDCYKKCRHGGYCMKKDNSDSVCQCPEGYEGTRCQHVSVCSAAAVQKAALPDGSCYAPFAWLHYISLDPNVSFEYQCSVLRDFLQCFGFQVLTYRQFDSCGYNRILQLFTDAGLESPYGVTLTSCSAYVNEASLNSGFPQTVDDVCFSVGSLSWMFAYSGCFNVFEFPKSENKCKDFNEALHCIQKKYWEMHYMCTFEDLREIAKNVSTELINFDSDGSIDDCEDTPSCSGNFLKIVMNELCPNQLHMLQTVDKSERCDSYFPFMKCIRIHMLVQRVTCDNDDILFAHGSLVKLGNMDLAFPADFSPYDNCSRDDLDELQHDFPESLDDDVCGNEVIVDYFWSTEKCYSESENTTWSSYQCVMLAEGAECITQELNDMGVPFCEFDDVWEASRETAKEPHKTCLDSMEEASCMPQYFVRLSSEHGANCSGPWNNLNSNKSDWATPDGCGRFFDYVGCLWFHAFVGGVDMEVCPLAGIAQTAVYTRPELGGVWNNPECQGHFQDVGSQLPTTVEESCTNPWIIKGFLANSRPHCLVGVEKAVAEDEDNETKCSALVFGANCLSDQMRKFNLDCHHVDDIMSTLERNSSVILDSEILQDLPGVCSAWIESIKTGSDEDQKCDLLMLYYPYRFARCGPPLVSAVVPWFSERLQCRIYTEVMECYYEEVQRITMDPATMPELQYLNCSMSTVHMSIEEGLQWWDITSEFDITLDGSNCSVPEFPDGDSTCRDTELTVALSLVLCLPYLGRRPDEFSAEEFCNYLPYIIRDCAEPSLKGLGHICTSDEINAAFRNESGLVRSFVPQSDLDRCGTPSTDEYSYEFTIVLHGVPYNDKFDDPSSYEYQWLMGIINQVLEFLHSTNDDCHCFKGFRNVKIWRHTSDSTRRKRQAAENTTAMMDTVGISAEAVYEKPRSTGQVQSHVRSALIDAKSSGNIDTTIASSLSTSAEIIVHEGKEDECQPEQEEWVRLIDPTKGGYCANGLMYGFDKLADTEKCKVLTNFTGCVVSGIVQNNPGCDFYHLTKGLTDGLSGMLQNFSISFDHHQCGCIGYPCINKGVCVEDEGYGSYSCICEEGFTGYNCEHDGKEDECAPKEEEYAALIDARVGGHCGYYLWHGFNSGLSSVKDKCQVLTNFTGCVNYGILEKNPGCDFHHLAAGFVHEMGTLLDSFNITFDHHQCGCIGYPCRNWGDCVYESYGNYSCKCKEGFTGHNCEHYGGKEDECAPKEEEYVALIDARVGGHCGYYLWQRFNSGLSSVKDKCEVLTNFTGCVNYGILEKNPGCDFHHLAAGFVHGMDALLDSFNITFDHHQCGCMAYPCVNWGRCVDELNGSYNCTCNEGFTGHNCENYEHSYGVYIALPGVPYNDTFDDKQSYEYQWLMETIKKVLDFLYKTNDDCDCFIEYRNVSIWRNPGRVKRQAAMNTTSPMEDSLAVSAVLVYGQPRSDGQVQSHVRSGLIDAKASGEIDPSIASSLSDMAEITVHGDTVEDKCEPAEEEYVQLIDPRVGGHCGYSLMGDFDSMSVFEKCKLLTNFTDCVTDGIYKMNTGCDPHDIATEFAKEMDKVLEDFNITFDSRHCGCMDRPCRHKGVCIDEGDGYYNCLCEARFTGYNCEMEKCRDYEWYNCLVDPCMNKTCSEYPDAECISDYCHGCNFRFMKDGVDVTDTCENAKKLADLCFEMLPDDASCPNMTGFYYNGQYCQEITETECGGTANMFYSQEECERACSRPERCHQPMEIGPCEAIMPRYYYDVTSDSCEWFGYGGCQGNKNNFVSKAACQVTCQQDSIDVVTEFCPPLADPLESACRSICDGGCPGIEICCPSECDQGKCYDPSTIPDSPCDSNPCENGGHCTSSMHGPDGASFECTCEWPYEGMTCNMYNCDKLGCQNGGICEKNWSPEKMNYTSWYCDCPLGYTGIDCGETSGAVLIPGCPSLETDTFGICVQECNVHDDCNGTYTRCCSNGCGHVCVDRDVCTDPMEVTEAADNCMTAMTVYNISSLDFDLQCQTLFGYMQCLSENITMKFKSSWESRACTVQDMISFFRSGIDESRELMQMVGVPEGFEIEDCAPVSAMCDYCKNGGTCMISVTSTWCVCPAGLAGAQCDIVSEGESYCQNATAIIEAFNSPTCPPTSSFNDISEDNVTGQCQQMEVFGECVAEAINEKYPDSFVRCAPKDFMEFFIEFFAKASVEELLDLVSALNLDLTKLSSFAPNIFNCGCLPNPCQNGGTCSATGTVDDEGMGFNCACTENWTGKHCDQCVSC